MLKSLLFLTFLGNTYIINCFEALIFDSGESLLQSDLVINVFGGESTGEVRNVHVAERDLPVISVTYELDPGGEIKFDKVLPLEGELFWCEHADHFVFMYSHMDVSSGTAKLEITLMDDHECGITGVCENSNVTYEYFTYTDDTILLSVNSVDHEWMQMKIPFDSFVLDTTRSTKNGNEVLDKEFLRGFSFRFFSESGIQGGLLFSDIGCQGEDVAGSSLTSNRGRKVLYIHEPSMEKLDFFYPLDSANTSEYFTHIPKNTLEDFHDAPVLQFDYKVRQVEIWGGFISVTWAAPDLSYYDASHATHMSFWYNNIRKQSNPERAHVRFVMGDSSDCFPSCKDPNNVEVYYSFHFILDNDPGWRQISIELEGDGDASSPFWRTGWAGTIGNNRLDKNRLKFFKFEISIDSLGDPYSETEGTILFSQIQFRNLTKAGAEKRLELLGCLSDSVVVFSKPWKKREFSHGKCCELCRSLPECRYYQTNQRDCLLYDKIDPSTIRLRTSSEYRYRFYWMNDTEKIGLACSQMENTDRLKFENDICVCSSNGTVDCTNRNLTMIPHIPAYLDVNHLDLAGNPDLSIIWEGQLSHLNGKLVSINIMNTGVQTLSTKGLPSSLQFVHFDSNEGKVKNLVQKELGKFSNVCCEKTETQLVDGNGRDIIGCGEILEWEPCVDCVLEEFYSYHDESTPLDIITIESLFSMATQSPEICGEICSRTDKCTHFTWDGRKGTSPTCYLKINDKGRIFLNASNTWGNVDYSPGYVSGYTAKARALLHNATVHLAYLPEKENGKYVTTNDRTIMYGLRIASKPLRGAIWITPRLRVFQKDITDLSVTITPSTIVFYKESYQDVLNVSIRITAPENITGALDLEITHDVESCDKAFVSNPDQMKWLSFQTRLYLKKPLENRNSDLKIKLLCMIFCIINVSIATIFLVWTILYRKHPVVAASQSIFLSMIAMGAIVSSLAMIPIITDDSGDVEGLARSGEYVFGNQACQLQIVLYSVGFVVTFSPLFAKTWRLSKIFNNTKVRGVRISNFQTFSLVLGILSIDLAILISYYVYAPIKLFRVVKSEDEFGNPTSSITVCRSENESTVYITLLVLFHIAVLIYGNYICYTVRNFNNTILSEGKYVSVAMFSNLQVLAFAVPLIIIVEEDPISTMVVRSGVIFLNDLTTQLLIFVPKILAVRENIGFSSTVYALSSRQKPSGNDKPPAQDVTTVEGSMMFSENTQIY